MAMGAPGKIIHGAGVSPHIPRERRGLPQIRVYTSTRREPQNFAIVALNCMILLMTRGGKVALRNTRQWPGSTENDDFHEAGLGVILVVYCSSAPKLLPWCYTYIRNS